MATGNGAAPGPHLTPEQIDAFFEQYGWSYERAEEAEHVWHTDFGDERLDFHIYVQLSDDWVLFTVYPFTVRPEGDAARARVAERLATLNNEITLAKTGIDEDGDTFLTVELPTEDFTFTHFRAALDALVEAAPPAHLELTLLATGG
jgi:hypothetical protein